MKKFVRSIAASVLGAGLALTVLNAQADTAADNVRLSAAPASDGVAGNECTNRSIQPFARSKDNTFSDDALRVALNVLKGAAGGTEHMALNHAFGGKPAL